VADDCIFCKILDGKLPSKKIVESPGCVAIEDKFPQAPVHALVIPRRHIASLQDANESDLDLLGEMLLLARKVAIAKGIHEKGYRVITNIGADGGQAVPHLHFHVLGGKRLGAKLVAEG
jgi:histidine triad (HIT) family protein